MDAPVKRCSRCEQELPATLKYFHRDNSKKDGFRPYCKICNKHSADHFEECLPDGVKRCVRCEQALPATIVYFYYRKGAKDSLSNCCRVCRRAKYIPHPINRETPERKTCPCCVTEKPIDQFTKSKTTLSGYGTLCRKCDNERTKIYRRRHAKERREYDQGRRRKYIYLDRIYSNNRAARKRALPDYFTVQDWEHCLDYWNGCCAYCGQPAGLWITIAMDHFIPITSSECPGTVPTNIIPACHAVKDGQGGCNNAKSKREPEIWLIEKFGERKAKKILKRIKEYFASLSQ